MKERLNERQLPEQDEIYGARAGRERMDSKSKIKKPNKADIWKTGYFFPHLPFGFFL